MFRSGNTCDLILLLDLKLRSVLVASYSGLFLVSKQIYVAVYRSYLGNVLWHWHWLMVLVCLEVTGCRSLLSVVEV